MGLPQVASDENQETYGIMSKEWRCASANDGESSAAGGDTRKRKAQALSARKLPPGEGTRSVSATDKGFPSLGYWRSRVKNEEIVLSSLLFLLSLSKLSISMLKLWKWLAGLLLLQPAFY
jgi:hypothetical protein